VNLRAAEMAAIKPDYSGLRGAMVLSGPAERRT